MLLSGLSVVSTVQDALTGFYVTAAGRAFGVIMMSAGLAATVVGFLGRLVPRRLRLPPLVMAVAGITPLLPGLTTYRGVLKLAVLDDPGG